MKKKGLVAMGLAGVMTIGMCVPVLAADDTINQENINTSSSKDTSVEYSITPEYSITIPATISLDSGNEDQRTFDFKGTTGNISANKSVKVSISGLIEDGKLELTPAEDGNATIKADIKLGTNVVKNADVVAEYIQGDAVGSLKTLSSDSLVVTPPTDKQWAGTYTGTLTFAVAYSNK